MAIDQELLDILCCPDTHAVLKVLPEKKIEKMNALIAQGKVKFKDDTPVEQPLQEALVTEDGKTIYRVDDEIPIMLINRGIPTEQLGDF